MITFLVVGLISWQNSGKSDHFERKFQSYKRRPVLCYHNIKKEPVKGDLLTISEEQLGRQIKWLFQHGYHTISPAEYLWLLNGHDNLPSKPIMLSFDDSHKEHFSIVKPLIEKYNYKGVFFIMTVCLNKEKYLTNVQIKSLSDAGHNWKSYLGSPQYDNTC